MLLIIFRNIELCSGTDFDYIFEFSSRNIGKFQHYHYGTDENLQIYGQPTPPEYDLSNVRTKIHILYGTNDLLSPAQVK